MSLKKNAEFLVSLGLTIALLLPFLILSYYSHPNYDDYEMYGLKKGMNYFETQVWWYTNWSGRYTPFGLSPFLHPLSFSKINWYGYLGMAAIVGFSISIFHFIRSVFTKANLISQVWIFLGFMYLFLIKLPSTYELFFWIPATMSYTLGMILCFILGSTLIKSNGNFSFIKILGVLFLAILIPGTSELIIALFLANYCALLFFSFLNKAQINKTHYLIIGVLIFFLGFSFFAPGNSVRAAASMTSSTTPKNLPEILHFTVLFGIKNIIKWVISGPFLLFLALSATLKNQIDPRLEKLLNTFPKFLVWVLMHVCLFFFTIFIVVYSTGFNIPERVINLYYFYFIVSSSIAFIILSNKLKLGNLNLTFEYKTLIASFLVFYSVVNRNIISRALIDWRGGIAVKYHQEVLDLYKLCEENQGKDIVILPFKNRPNTIFSNDLHSNAKHWENVAFSKYHKINSIRVDKTNSPYPE
jgi:hypothetical protein